MRCQECGASNAVDRHAVLCRHCYDEAFGQTICPFCGDYDCESAPYCVDMLHVVDKLPIESIFVGLSRDEMNRLVGE